MGTLKASAGSQIGINYFGGVFNQECIENLLDAVR